MAIWVLPGGLINNAITKIMFGFYRFMVNRAPCIIGYSEDYADHSYYLSPVREKARAIYPPIQIPNPDQDVARMLRNKWNPEGGPIIGYSGRFVQEKRPDLLIRSLEVINSVYPKARIVFAGEYDIPYEGTWKMHRDLVRQYQPQLKFLGLLRDKQDLANFYAACNLLVLPSDTECFALVQVEAMLCGTPVVMTDIPGGRVPVRTTGMGKLARQGDANSIGEAVLEVLANPAAYHRSREDIAAIFDFETFVAQYEAIFRKYAR